MIKKDISYFDEDTKIKFNFRVAVISYNNNKILLQKCNKDSFYSLIGGRVKLGESSLTAIKRELKEETGIEVKDEELTLINIVENFFTYNNTKYHELLYIYKVENEEINAMGNFKTLDKEDSFNEWFSTEDINKLDIRPKIIKTSYNSKKLKNIIIED